MRSPSPTEDATRHSDPPTAIPAPFEGPLFLVGMPRSGTKLLRALLNRHPNISIMTNETEFLPYLVSHWESFGDLSDFEAFERFYRSATKFPYLMSRRVHGNLISARDWHQACRSFDPAGVFEALLRHDTKAERGSGVIWGDKSPGYVRKIPMLKELYPDARIIHIIRDARDYCASIRKAWGKNIYRAAQRWNDDVAWARECGKAIDGYFELRYEDLLADPPAKLAALCSFVGVAYTPEMTSLLKPSENIGDTREQAFIVRDNFGKYRKALKSREIRFIEALTTSTLSDLDYAVDETIKPTRLSGSRLALYRAFDGVNLIISGIPRLGFMGTLRKYMRTFIVSPNRID